MKKLAALLASLFLLVAPAHAGLIGVSNPTIKYTAPDTANTVIGLFGCEDYSYTVDGDNGIVYLINNCSGTHQLNQVWPQTLSTVTGLSAALAAKANTSALATVAFTGVYADLTGQPTIPTLTSQLTNDAGFITSSSLSPYLTSSLAATTYFPKPTGTTAQYLDGTGATRAFPSPVARTFQYPSRALNSCFQISNTQDADFHYKVDVTTGLSLTSGAQGTVTATSYTNSGCTTGAQVVADGTSAQSGTLIVGLGINQIIDVSLDGTAPAGKWLKLTTANTSGTPTFALRAVQAETLLP